MTMMEGFYVVEPLLTRYSHTLPTLAWTSPIRLGLTTHSCASFMHLSEISLYICVYKFSSLCELHCSTLPLWIVVVLVNLARTLKLLGYVQKYAIMKANIGQKARLVSETWRRV